MVILRQSATLAHEHNPGVVPGEGGGGVQGADHEVVVHDADVPVGKVRLAASGIHESKDSRGYGLVGVADLDLVHRVCLFHNGLALGRHSSDPMNAQVDLLLCGWTIGVLGRGPGGLTSLLLLLLVLLLVLLLCVFLDRGRGRARGG